MHPRLPAGWSLCHHPYLYFHLPGMLKMRYNVHNNWRPTVPDNIKSKKKHNTTILREIKVNSTWICRWMEKRKPTMTPVKEVYSAKIKHAPLHSMTTQKFSSFGLCRLFRLNSWTNNKVSFALENVVLKETLCNFLQNDSWLLSLFPSTYPSSVTAYPLQGC